MKEKTKLAKQATKHTQTSNKTYTNKQQNIHKQATKHTKTSNKTYTDKQQNISKHTLTSLAIFPATTPAKTTTVMTFATWIQLL